MHVVKVIATLECDGCGSYFDVELDAASSTENYSIWDHSIDAVTDCLWLSREDDKIYCKTCTRKRDEVNE